MPSTNDLASLARRESFELFRSPKWALTIRLGEILLPILLHAGAAGFARSASLLQSNENMRAVVWLDESSWNPQYQVTDAAHTTYAKAGTNGRG